jgi:hypothetical protein
MRIQSRGAFLVEAGFLAVARAGVASVRFAALATGLTRSLNIINPIFYGRSDENARVFAAYDAELRRAAFGGFRVRDPIFARLHGHAGPSFFPLICEQMSYSGIYRSFCQTDAREGLLNR